MSTNQNGMHRSFLNTEAIVLGLLLGGLLTAFAGQAFLEGHHLIETAVEETLWTALYLTFLVGYVGFQYPTLFTSRPRLAVFALCFIAGHISLFFDSFAVILLFVFSNVIQWTEVTDKIGQLRSSLGSHYAHHVPADNHQNIA